MRILFLIGLIIIFYNFASAQYKISGTVVDSATQSLLQGASVLVQTLGRATSTNFNGEFLFSNISTGSFIIKVSFVGYKTENISLNIENDTILRIAISKIDHEINTITILADRPKSKLEEIPVKVAVITNEDYSTFPVQNFDDILQSIPNVYVNRSWGIFSKNSSVSMRGLDGTSRVLVLYNGVPLNKTAGGGINWHIINTDDIQQVEVQKGPSSAVYGNNAMTGVINILSKKPTDKLAINLSTFVGRYKTLGGRFHLSQNLKDSSTQRGLYYSLSGFYRQGDGYNIIPPDLVTESDIPLYLSEYQGKALLGYTFNENHFFETEYTYYLDNRGEGIKIYEEDGGNLSYNVHYIRSTYQTKVGEMPANVNIFYHNQRFSQHSERLNQTGDTYKLYDRNQDADDAGIWMNASRQISDNQNLIFGLDGKTGSMLSEEIYRTSTDYLRSEGRILFGATFIQHQYTYKQFGLTTAIRYDAMRFDRGSLLANDPTSVTGFEAPVDSTFSEYSQTCWSPKIALKYLIAKKYSTYISFSKGFMPPKLDDMTTSRKINKGFKVANPELKPEKLNNYEIGFTAQPHRQIKIDGAVYFSQGSDFHYFIETGDTVDIDKPVLKRENISKVNVLGAEITLAVNLTNKLKLQANYSYNHSTIVEYDLLAYTGDDITNKFISETPMHQAFAGIYYNATKYSVSLVSNYIGEMWIDEQNSDKLDDYLTIDLRAQYRTKYGIAFTADIQNLFNVEYIDKKGGLCSGRFYVFELKYMFRKKQ